MGWNFNHNSSGTVCAGAGRPAGREAMPGFSLPLIGIGDSVSYPQTLRTQKETTEAFLFPNVMPQGAELYFLFKGQVGKVASRGIPTSPLLAFFVKI